MDATATQLKAVDAINRNGDSVHVTFESSPEGLVDERGEIILPPPKESLMVRADTKLAEKIELSKMMIAVIAIVPALMLVLLNYGASAIGWVRNDESRHSQIQSLQKDVETMKGDVKDIKKTLQALEVKEAYKLGAGTSHENERPKEK